MSKLAEQVWGVADIVQSWAAKRHWRKRRAGYRWIGWACVQVKHYATRYGWPW